MLNINSLSRTPSEHDRYNDARLRAERAAQELGCAAGDLQPYSHQSHQDAFFEATTNRGQPLFIKSHLGTSAELKGWAEPAAGLWAQRTGLGPRVFPTSQPGVLVTERLRARSMTREEGNMPHVARQVAQALHHMHTAVPGDGQSPAPSVTGSIRSGIIDAMNPAQPGARAVSQALVDQVLAQADWIDQELSGYAIELKKRFGDCHAGNWMIEQGRLRAVDFADSAFGDPFADIARFAFCQRFDQERVQNMLTWYCETGGTGPTDDERRRLHLHVMAQDLDYLGYFAKSVGLTHPQTQHMASRVLANQAREPACPPITGAHLRA